MFLAEAALCERLYDRCALGSSQTDTKPNVAILAQATLAQVGLRVAHRWVDPSVAPERREESGASIWVLATGR